jgi:hypothetical protein
MQGPSRRNGFDPIFGEIRISSLSCPSGYRFRRGCSQRAMNIRFAFADDFDP